MDSRRAIGVVFLLIYFVTCVGSTGYRPLPDDQYDIILKLLRNTFNVPVKERTREQHTAIVKLWRNKYTLAKDGNTILLNGQPIIRSSQVQPIVKKAIHKTKGSGARKIYKSLAKNVVGLSERRVQDETEKSGIYSHLNAKFPNTGVLRPIYAKHIQDIHQIDLLDLYSLRAHLDGKLFRYVLSVIDVFSRFLWLVALERKTSSVIARALNSIYLVHGPPKILQTDNGKEFHGAVKKLMLKLGVNIIRSSPYHPQSQGKVERSHGTLRRKIMYDLLKKTKSGTNWVKMLPMYNNILNEEPKAELAWKSSFEVYFGRHVNSCSISNKSLKDKDTHVSLPSGSLREPESRHFNKFFESRRKIRKKARIATERINQLTIKRRRKNKPPSVYKVNDKVLVRLTKSKKARLSKATVVQAVVVKVNRRLDRYKVGIESPNGDLEYKWVPVADLTSRTLKQEREKKIVVRNERSKYLIELTHEDRLFSIVSQGFDVALDPDGDGSCQFSAIADQLVSIGIHRSSDTLRKEVVQDIRSRPYTCDGSDIALFVDNNDLPEYLAEMERSNTYGDHLTLLRIAEIFHCRILVVSIRGPNQMQLVGSRGPLLFLGYLPEGEGEHYVSLQPRPGIDLSSYNDDLEITNADFEADKASVNEETVICVHATEGDNARDYGVNCPTEEFEEVSAPDLSRCTQGSVQDTEVVESSTELGNSVESEVPSTERSLLDLPV